MARTVFALLCLTATAAGAQAALPAAALQVRYGGTYRSGQQASADGLSYQGLSPNDWQVGAGFFFVPRFGLVAQAQRDAFGLARSGGPLGSGALLRGQLGPALQLLLGRLQLLLSLGYQASQLPSFVRDPDWRLAPTLRHAAYVSARARAVLFWRVAAELSAQGQVGAAERLSPGVSASAALSVGLFTVERLEVRAAVDYQYAWDTDWSATQRVHQRLSRFGVNLEVAWLFEAEREKPERATDAAPPPLSPPPARPTTGGVTLTVLDAAQKLALPEALVELDGQAYVTDATGQVALTELSPGNHAIKVTATGFTPLEQALVIVAGARPQVSVALSPAGVIVAKFRGVVRSAEGGEPLPARVVVGERSISCNAAGQFQLDIEPGTYRLIITSPGYRPQEKLISVQAGQDVVLNADLHRVAR